MLTLFSERLRFDWEQERKNLRKFTTERKKKSAAAQGLRRPLYCSSLTLSVSGGHLTPEVCFTHWTCPSSLGGVGTPSLLRHPLLSLDPLPLPPSSSLLLSPLTPSHTPAGPEMTITPSGEKLSRCIPNTVGKMMYKIAERALWRALVTCLQLQ